VRRVAERCPESRKIGGHHQLVLATPGFLMVAVLLKSNPSLSDSAAAVAQVYLPSYLLSIVTIAAWTALGLYVTLPDENGHTFCQR